jgi:hypothetical protein
MSKQRITIGHTPYLLERLSAGWFFQATEARTDNLWRHYTVRVGADGRPVSCTCPHHCRKGAFCKHMRHIEQLWQAEHPEHAARVYEEAVRCGLLDVPVVPPPAEAPTTIKVSGVRYRSAGDMARNDPELYRREVMYARGYKGS